MKRYFRLHRIFVVQYLKRLMEYKVDFLLGAIGLVIAQAIQILFIGIIFSQIPKLQGWSFEEILFIYGFSLIPKSVDHLFFDNLWMVGYRIIRKGEFDKYLTRPINSLYHVLVENFCVDAFGEMLTCILLLGYAIPRLSLPFHWYTIPLLLVVVVFATMIYTALKIMTSAISFWTKQSGHITHMHLCDPVCFHRVFSGELFFDRQRPAVLHRRHGDRGYGVDGDRAVCMA